MHIVAPLIPVARSWSEAGPGVATEGGRRGVVGQGAEPEGVKG